MIRIGYVPKRTSLATIPTPLEYRSHCLFPPRMIFARLEIGATVRDPFSHFIASPGHRASDAHGLGHAARASKSIESADRHPEHFGGLFSRHEQRLLNIAD